MPLKLLAPLNVTPPGSSTTSAAVPVPVMGLLMMVEPVPASVSAVGAQGHRAGGERERLPEVRLLVSVWLAVNVSFPVNVMELLPAAVIVPVVLNEVALLRVMGKVASSVPASQANEPVPRAPDLPRISVPRCGVERRSAAVGVGGGAAQGQRPAANVTQGDGVCSIVGDYARVGAAADDRGPLALDRHRGRNGGRREDAIRQGKRGRRRKLVVDRRRIGRRWRCPSPSMNWIR